MSTRTVVFINPNGVEPTNSLDTTLLVFIHDGQEHTARKWFDFVNHSVPDFQVCVSRHVAGAAYSLYPGPPPTDPPPDGVHIYTFTDPVEAQHWIDADIALRQAPTAGSVS